MDVLRQLIGFLLVLNMKIFQGHGTHALLVFFLFPHSLRLMAFLLTWWSLLCNSRWILLANFKDLNFSHFVGSCEACYQYCHVLLSGSLVQWNLDDAYNLLVAQITLMFIAFCPCLGKDRA